MCSQPSERVGVTFPLDDGSAESFDRSPGFQLLQVQLTVDVAHGGRGAKGARAVGGVGVVLTSVLYNNYEALAKICNEL